MKKSNVLNVLWDYFLMTVGSVIFCMAWTSFVIPNGLASGGLTGLCTIIQYGLGIPIGISYPVVNILLLILGFLSLGKSFGFKTIYVILLTSLLFEVLPKFPQLEVMMDEKLLVALVGASLESVGIGLVLLRGGSTGGTDIIAMMINKYWPVSPGKVYLYTDVFIISCLLFVPEKGLVDMIYAFVMMLGFSFGVDYAAVDTHTDAVIRKAFAEEIHGTTKLIIAQRVASVQEADLILVLDGGRIAAQGTHEQLLQTSSIYREVYDSQTKGGDE